MQIFSLVARHLISIIQSCQDDCPLEYLQVKVNIGGKLWL